MLYRKTCYCKIEKVHRKTLKVIYNNNQSYNSLLLQNSSVSIHQRHLHFLINEIYKSIFQVNPEFMWSYFTHKEMPYNLRKRSIFNSPTIYSTCYDTFVGELPASIKSSQSLRGFERI